MSNILTCQCGARLRLPETATQRSFRCPKCKAQIVRPSANKAPSPARARVSAVGATCPICQTKITAEEQSYNCPQCEQSHHRECWSEMGGCGTYGCQQAPAAEKEGGAQTPLTAWGDTKKCPVCGEVIKSIALRCRYCHTDFDTVDPQTLTDFRSKIFKGEKSTTLQKQVIALFVLSLFGCLAPFIAIAAAALLLPKRKQLAKEGPIYMVLGYSALILSLIYSFLLLVFSAF